jgi:hypothetical protein
MHTYLALLILTLLYKSNIKLKATLFSTIAYQMFYHTGVRNNSDSICLLCGTMFYDDMHTFSGLIVFTKTTYILIVAALYA